MAITPKTTENTEKTVTDTTPPTVSFAPITPNPRNSSVNTIPITFSEVVTGFDQADLSLTLNGVPISLGDATLNTQDNINWSLDNITGITSANGNYQLTLSAANSGISDRAGNLLNTNATDTWSSDFTAPSAAVSLTNINEAGGITNNFTVTYTDDNAVNVTSLNSNNIIVTGPNGFSQQATLVNVTPTNNGTPVTATYSFTPPGGSWDTADNGIYTVQLQPNQVSDTVGNFEAAGSLGTLTVNIPTSIVPPTPATPSPSSVNPTTTTPSPSSVNPTTTTPSPSSVAPTT
ncbi:MAG: hypothetical protein ACRCT1_04420, partial [Microcoleaceae cyanobacterium]